MDKYEIIEQIGEGLVNFGWLYIFRTYGLVFKAWNKVDGVYYAIKRFRDSCDDNFVSYIRGIITIQIG